MSIDSYSGGGGITAEDQMKWDDDQREAQRRLGEAQNAGALASTQLEIDLFNQSQAIQSQHRAELAGLNNQLLGIQHADKMRTLKSEVAQALISNAWTRLKHVASNMKY